ILDFISDYFPAPNERGPFRARNGSSDVNRPVEDKEPAAIYIYKTVADPFAGRVSYFKVMSGIVKNDANLDNYRTGTHERLAHISTLKGKLLDGVTDLHA